MAQPLAVAGFGGDAEAGQLGQQFRAAAFAAFRPVADLHDDRLVGMGQERLAAALAMRSTASARVSWLTA